MPPLKDDPMLNAQHGAPFKMFILVLEKRKKTNRKLKKCQYLLFWLTDVTAVVVKM